jgi:catalase
MTRAAATLHPEDDDFGQARTLYTKVLDGVARERLVSNIAGHVSAVTRVDLLERVFEYWTNIDPNLGARVRAAVSPLSD